MIILISSCSLTEKAVLERYNGTVVRNNDLNDREDLRVLVPDLERGKCVVLMMPGGECMLIDCASGKDFPVLYETLKKFDINVIDLIVLTSKSEETMGGLEMIAENFTVCGICVSEDMKTTDTYRRIELLSKRCSIALSPVCEGTRIYDFDNICIDVVATQKYSYTKETDAICLYIICGSRSIFVEGECDIGAEAKMASELKERIKSDVIILPYSGTSGYISQYFYEETKPDFALIPIYNGNYPSEAVLKRLKDTEILRTDLDGNIMIITDGSTLKFNTFSVENGL